MREKRRDWETGRGNRREGEREGGREHARRERVFA